MNPKLTIAQNVLITLLDGGDTGDVKSAKKVAKYLGLQRNAIHQAFFKLKQAHLVTSCGYGDYELTEAGRVEAGLSITKSTVLHTDTLSDEADAPKVLEYKEESPAAAPVLEMEPVTKPEATIDYWEDKYWKLFEEYKQLALTAAKHTNS
jgi:Mn-dependent DtxR family transcriptional regulator